MLTIMATVLKSCWVLFFTVGMMVFIICGVVRNGVVQKCCVK